MTPEELGKRLYEVGRMPKEYAVFVRSGWSYDPANRVVEKLIGTGTVRLHLSSEGQFQCELALVDGSATVLATVPEVLGHVAQIEDAYNKAALEDILSKSP